ncbi:hypothetical protein AX16_001098, partial [Volvariella volvacea WC 439]
MVASSTNDPSVVEQHESTLHAALGSSEQQAPGPLTAEFDGYLMVIVQYGRDGPTWSLFLQTEWPKGYLVWYEPEHGQWVKKGPAFRPYFGTSKVIKVIAVVANMNFSDFETDQPLTESFRTFMEMFSQTGDDCYTLVEEAIWALHDPADMIVVDGKGSRPRQALADWMKNLCDVVDETIEKGAKSGLNLGIGPVIQVFNDPLTVDP